jgi:hypothetical protein
MLPNASKAVAIHIYVYTIFSTCKILSLVSPWIIRTTYNVNKSTFSALVIRSAVEPNRYNLNFSNFVTAPLVRIFLLNPPDLLIARQ